MQSTEELPVTDGYGRSIRHGAICNPYLKKSYNCLCRMLSWPFHLRNMLIGQHILEVAFKVFSLGLRFSAESSTVMPQR